MKSKILVGLLVSVCVAGYESATSPFGPTVADDLIAGELKLLGDLAK